MLCNEEPQTRGPYQLKLPGGQTDLQLYGGAGLRDLHRMVGLRQHAGAVSVTGVDALCVKRDTKKKTKGELFFLFFFLVLLFSLSCSFLLSVKKEVG